MNSSEIQYVSNQDGQAVAVILPIDLWRELQAEQETAYLLKSETMKQRLLAAKNRQTGMSMEEVCEKLGI